MLPNLGRVAGQWLGLGLSVWDHRRITPRPGTITSHIDAGRCHGGKMACRHDTVA